MFVFYPSVPLLRLIIFTKKEGTGLTSIIELKLPPSYAIGGYIQKIGLINIRDNTNPQTVSVS